MGSCEVCGWSVKALQLRQRIVTREWGQAGRGLPRCHWREDDDTKHGRLASGNRDSRDEVSVASRARETGPRVPSLFALTTSTATVAQDIPTALRPGHLRLAKHAPRAPEPTSLCHPLSPLSHDSGERDQRAAYGRYPPGPSQSPQATPTPVDQWPLLAPHPVPAAAHPAISSPN